MFFYNCLILLFGLIISVNAQDDNANGINIFEGLSLDELERNFYLSDDQVQEKQNVKIQVYYESLCPGSKNFVSTELSATVLKLSQYLDIFLYPYGGAKTTEKDGHYEFQCQHGPLECYGNKLHACAIDIIKNMTTSVLFNGCMMESSENLGSDDITADQCGIRLKIDSAPIKECAKGDKGSILLKQYGEETKRLHLHYVPYKLVNGKESKDSDFMDDVCAAFVNPPPPCSTQPLDYNIVE